MKRTFLALTLALVGFAVAERASACAMCVDIYEENLTLASEVSAELISQGKLNPAKKSQLVGLECTKSGGLTGEAVETTCVVELSRDFKNITEIRLSGNAALQMLRTVAGLNAEIIPGGEERAGPAPAPTGKKKPVGSRRISGDEYSFSIRPQVAWLDCSNTKACTIEFVTLTLRDIPVSLW